MSLWSPLLVENVNHVEIFVLKSFDSCPNSRYVVNLTEDKFKTVFDKVRRTKKYFKKSNVNTFNGTLEHMSDGVNEYVQEMKIENCSRFSKSNHDFLKVSYDKKNKSVFSFPSNEMIYDITHNQRYTFKLNPCVYLNFQISENFNGERNRQIFFNVNRSKAYEESSVCKIINETIDLF
jgi:hypothetical protein